MPAEIAIRQLTGLAEALAGEGVDFSEFLHDLPSVESKLGDVFARVDWQDYVCVLERIRSRYGEAILRRMGSATISTTGSSLFRTNLLLGYDDPRAALKDMCQPDGVLQTITPCVEIGFDITGPRRCTLRTRMREGYPPCWAHHEIAAGTIAEIPKILFEKPATVTLQSTDEGVEYDVLFARPKPTARLRRRWVRSHPNRAYLTQISGVFKELAERQATLQQESRLRADSEERLRRVEKLEALGQLTGGVAHDFNNLLLVIQGNLDLLQSRVSDPKSQVLFQAATDAVERGADLTRQLLAAGRQSPLQPESLDLRDVVAQMETLLSRTLGENVDIQVSHSEALWQTHVDRGLLQNAILNLAINARDAMPAGGHLTISTENVTITEAEAQLSEGELSPGRYVLMTVSDDGIGMSNDVASRAFDPFFTTKALDEGTGMGLAMVYGFLQQSKGMIRLTTQLDKGSSFRIYLPAACESAEHAATDTSDTGSAAHTPHRFPEGKSPDRPAAARS
jgi:signal transduction histidine kinase